MFKYLLVLTIIASSAHASTDKIPQDFTHESKNFVFIDIHSAEYEIEYDISQKKTTAISKLSFEIKSAGYPLFDLVPKINKIFLNKEKHKALTVSLPDGGNMRALDTHLEPGVYLMEIHNEIDENTDYSTWFSKKVRAAFWMSDLEDRKLLESYLPTNLEFDQIKMGLTVKVLGSQTEHVVKSNGTIETRGFNEFFIDYPDYYTSSSIYFHIYPKRSFEEKEFTIQSIDGREIKFQLYSRNSSTLASLFTESIKYFKELEKDYGAWPHPHLIVYAAGRSGMEYAGATQTGLEVLGHEMHHSYFARGITPARGNDGWIDEALASWRDKGYRQTGAHDLSTTRMSGHSPYRRYTDRAAYNEGEKIIAHLDQKFKDQGGLLPFLKEFATKNMFQINTTKVFQNSLEGYFNTDLNDFFQKYIYGSDGLSKAWTEENYDNPYHKQLTKKELLELL